jgi:hypothetical protein
VGETAADADWDTAARAPDPDLAEEERLATGRLQDAMLALRVRRGLLYKLLHRFRRPQTWLLLLWKRDVRQGSAARPGARRAYEVLHPGVLFDAGAALDGRLRSGSQAVLL